MDKRLNIVDSIQLHIGEFLQDHSKAIGNVEPMIAAIRPSWVVTDRRISDLPVEQAYYISLKDRHIYAVISISENDIVCRRQSLAKYLLGMKGALRVSVNETGWLASHMSIFSMVAPSFKVNAEGVLNGIGGSQRTSHLARLAHGVIRAFWGR